MKPDIHPDYHDVIFVDSATGTEWSSRSTVTSSETREIEGVEVPVVRLEISAVSHPFWTGTKRELDADGKIDRFRKRYGGSKPATAASVKTAEQDAAGEESAEEQPVEAGGAEEASDAPEKGADEAPADGEEAS
jgi:large subunit ribosomal protein L31